MRQRTLTQDRQPRHPQCQPASVDLVLVTCAYEQGDTSTDNLIVVATLIRATNRRN